MSNENAEYKDKIVGIIQGYFFPTLMAACSFFLYKIDNQNDEQRKKIEKLEVTNAAIEVEVVELKRRINTNENRINFYERSINKSN